MRLWLLLGLLVVASEDDAPLPLNAAEVIDQFPPGPGRTTTAIHCTSCHSPALIFQQWMSRERWDETITWMQETQNLWELDDSTRVDILDYLETVRGFDPDQRRPEEIVYRPNPIW